MTAMEKSNQNQKKWNSDILRSFCFEEIVIIQVWLTECELWGVFFSDFWMTGFADQQKNIVCFEKIQF